MTPVELKNLIKSDAQALQFAQAGNDEACAARCSEIAPQTRATTMLTERGLYDRLGALVAETILQKLDAFAKTADQMAPMVRRVLVWLQPVNGGADVGAAELLVMVGALKLKGVLTVDEAMAIDALSLVPQTVTAAEVAIAFRQTEGVSI